MFQITRATEWNTQNWKHNFKVFSSNIKYTENIDKVTCLLFYTKTVKNLMQEMQKIKLNKHLFEIYFGNI